MAKTTVRKTGALHELHLGDKHPTNRNGKSNGETDQNKQAEDVQVVAHLVKHQNLLL